MPLLPLDKWRELLAWNPWHFWGLADSTYVPVTRECSDIVYKYSWQGTGAGSREDIALAIEEAERKFRDYMFFWPAPRYSEDTAPFPAHYLAGQFGLGRYAVDGRYPAVTLPEGHIQALGTEKLTLVGAIPALAGSTFVYSDADGDGLNDMLTLTFTTTETDPLRFAVYFGAADRWDGSEVGEAWRVEPIKASIAGGVATIRIRRWLCVKPVRYETQEQETPLDPTDAGNFVTSLEVYTRTTDPTGITAATSQVAFTWEALPFGDYWYPFCCGGANNSSDPAAIATVAGRGGVRDSRVGIVSVGSAVYNSTSAVWTGAAWGSCRWPDRVTVRYLAGYPLKNGAMQEDYARLLAYWSAAELPNPPCADEPVYKRMYHYQFDLSRAQGEIEEQYAISGEDLNNPFGTRRGQILAWKRLRQDNNRVGRGVTA